jgi:hypothetical protein
MNQFKVSPTLNHTWTLFRYLPCGWCEVAVFDSKEEAESNARHLLQSDTMING